GAYGPSLEAVGGIVGRNSGSLTSSSASGVIDVDDFNESLFGGAADLSVGGAVGVNSATGTMTDVITDNEITVSVTGGYEETNLANVGGLAGRSEGVIEGGSSDAAMLVMNWSSGGAQDLSVGGAVGYLDSGATLTGVTAVADIEVLVTDGYYSSSSADV